MLRVAGGNDVKVWLIDFQVINGGEEGGEKIGI